MKPRCNILHLCLATACAIVPFCTQGRALGADMEILGGETLWRSHMTLRPAVVGTSEKTLSDQRPPSTWTFSGGNMASPLPSEDWTGTDFDDSAWPLAKAPFFGGYGDNRPAGAALVCLRGQFAVDDPGRVRDLKVDIAYRGGVVAYLNGKELGRKHIRQGTIEPLALADDYPRTAFVTRDGEALLPNYGRAVPPKDVVDRYESRIRKTTFDIPSDRLRPGVNVLAVELHRTAIPADLPPFGRGVWDTVGLLDAKLTAQAGSSITGDIVTKGGLQVAVADPWASLDPDAVVGSAGDTVGTIVLDAPLGGICSGQVVVSSAQPLDGLSVGVIPPKSKSGDTIPADAIQVRYAALGTSFVPLLPRPVNGEKVQPVWLTVDVPADATPGNYVGDVTIKASGKSVTVPIELTVHGFAVGDPKDWKTTVNLLQSPESVAGYYNVPLWSGEHFKLMEKSFELMALGGNDVLGISAVGKCVFGDDPLIVFRKQDGRYVPEWKFLDRYLESYDKIVGQPGFLSLNVWSYGMYLNGQSRDGGKVEWRNTLIPIVELKGNELVGVEIPIYGPGESEELWKQVMDGLRQRVKRLGWHDTQILLGTSGDAWPSSITTGMFKRIAPYAQWRVLTHGGGCPKWGITDHERTQPNGMVVGYLEIARRLHNSRVKLDRHPVPCNARDKVGSNPWTYRTLPITNTIATNYDGVCWKGIDYWTFDTPEGTRRNALNTYVHFGNMVGGTPKAMAMPGPDGAVSTVQFEMLREGIQECEAALMVRDGLKTLRSQPVATYDCIDFTLYGALIQQRDNGSKSPKNLEMKLILDQGRVTEVRPYAPTYNKPTERVGTIKYLDANDTSRFEADVTLGDDNWVKGGQGKWTIELNRDGNVCTGRFKGHWKGKPTDGKLTGVFTPDGYAKPIGEAPPKGELDKRCDAVTEDLCRLYTSTARHGSGQLRSVISRLYAAATEVAEAIEAREKSTATGE